MDERGFLLKYIKSFQNKMNLALLLEWCVLAAGAGALAALLAEITSLLIPFYYADLIAVLCIAAGLISGMMIAVLKRYAMKDAALAIDRFGFEERIITAYENLDREDWVIGLQRKNAAFLLEHNQNMAKQKIIPSWKRILPVVVLCLLTILAACLPSEKKELAVRQHELEVQAEEKQEEIKEALETLEEINTAGMTEEQIAQIEAMKDSLNASLAEMEEMASNRFMDPQSALASETAMSQANERLDYKMQNISEQLGQMSQQVASGQGMQDAAESLKDAANQFAGNSGQNGNNGQSQSGNSAQANNGQSQSGNSAQANNGQNGNGQGQNGNGQGENGNGQGQNGAGGGNEAGTGSSSNPHDYVSVPNALGNDETLHGNTTESDQSEYYREQNGLAWEGEHVAYESVIGNYTNQAYEGLEQGRYPSGMTDVIKDYFGGLQ